MASELEFLKDCLSAADFDAVYEFARGNRRTLSFLTALTYDQDRLVSWRAVEALGVVAAMMAESDAEYVRVHLRRLVWLLNDESGGIGWRAPEIIGEILHHEPELFSDFIPILVNLMDMEPEDAIRFRAGWLWAIGRLAAVRPDVALSALPWILPGLDDPDPQVRGMAVWCLGELGQPLSTEKMSSLQEDKGLVELYISPDIVNISIGDLARNLRLA